MTFEIIIVVCVGLAAAGVLLLAKKVLRFPLPKVVLPVVVGLAMLGYTQWSRYSWADRTVASFQPGQEVVERYGYDGYLEPWVMLFPRYDRLLVLDGAATRDNPAHPGIFLVRLSLMEQYAETISMSQFVDCGKRARAPVIGGVPVGPSGMPPDDTWISGGQPEDLYKAVCKSPDQRAEPPAAG